MLIEFYGWNCSHCENMRPLVEKLEKETGVKLDRKEVWKEENAANVELMEKYDQDQCGGVPYFYNTDTNSAICGECSYEELKTWALAKA